MAFKGFDTAEKILTQAKVNTLLNNSQYPAAFVGRYLKDAPNPLYSKQLSGTEINLLANAGIKIVSLFQYDGTNVTDFCASLGNTHAHDAVLAANGFCQPSGKPIYFAIDCPTSPSQMDNYVLPYFDAIAEYLSGNNNPNNYTMGIYGNAYACLRVKQEHPTVRIFVAGNLTQYGYTLTGYHIRQFLPSVVIGSGSSSVTVDKNTAYGAYGGWLPSSAPGPL